MAPIGNSEAFSRVLIDRELSQSGWDLLDGSQVRYEVNTSAGRADYLLFDSLGRVLGVVEAKRADTDPYEAKEQARGYADNVGAQFAILSNGNQHWLWNLGALREQDARVIERFPSRVDLERMRLRNMQPPRPLGTTPVTSTFLADVRSDVELRGYQVDALTTIADEFDQGARLFLLEMATGTGKTLLCAALIRQFLLTRNAERVLFIVDRIELARQTMEDFDVVLRDYNPVIFKSARRSGDLLGSSVVIATIQSLMTDRRYREEFTPFYFDLVINDEAHRSIYGGSREAVQFFQAARVGLTATPKAYLANVDQADLAANNPKALEARELRDTYRYFGCAPGEPTFRYDLVDAARDPEGPFLCMPKIVDCRSDITTKALEDAGWTVTIDEREETFKLKDLERKVFTPHRNRVMCEAFLAQAQREPSGELGRSIVFAVNQDHATAITKALNEVRPGVAVTITSRVHGASELAKDFRDGRRPERVAVSVDMLSTGYNCPSLLNVALMRPVFSPSEYLQIKGRGSRRFRFEIDGAFYEKTHFFLLDFCAVAEFFEDTYDYSIPLEVRPVSVEGDGGGQGTTGGRIDTSAPVEPPVKRDLPIWEGSDRIVSNEIRLIGPNGEKVDAMTFRGNFERDIVEFSQDAPDLHDAIEQEDDDGIESILQERFYHQPAMYYTPDKLVVSYGLPVSSATFVYAALGRRPLPTRELLQDDLISSISSRFELSFERVKWLRALTDLIVDDPVALRDFLSARYAQLFSRSQFRTLGGLDSLTRFHDREEVFEALRESPVIESSRLALDAREGRQ